MLTWIFLFRVANGSIIILKNNTRKQKVNVNIGISTLCQNLDEEISKAKVAVEYGAYTIMDLSDRRDICAIRQKLLEAAPITFWMFLFIKHMHTVLRSLRTH
jgi:phosphomethylpyrimidine synthase